RRAGFALAEKRLGLIDRHGHELADGPPAQLVLEHRRLETLAVAVLAWSGDAHRRRQVRVDETAAVTGRASAFGVGAEKGRFHPVGLGERLADVVEHPRIGGRVAAPGAADGALVDGHYPWPRRNRAVDKGALARACYA